MFLAGLGALIGYQVSRLGIFARLLGIREGVDVEDGFIRVLRASFRLERRLLIGLILLATGATVGAERPGEVARLRSGSVRSSPTLGMPSSA